MSACVRGCGGCASQGGIAGVFLADLVLQIFSYMAQVERESIKQCQAEGIAAAKARGVHLGCPAMAVLPVFAEVSADYESCAITRRQAAERLGVSMGAFDALRKRR